MLKAHGASLSGRAAAEIMSIMGRKRRQTIGQTMGQTIGQRTEQTIAGLFAAAVLLFGFAPASRAEYTTDWLANTFGTDAAHVGNAARSMWVAPEGTIYTASMWDEDEGGVAIYRNGQPLGSIGQHNEFQGSAMTGNRTSIFAALQYNAPSDAYGSGAVGRYDRTTHVRDLLIPVSATTTEQRADVITGLATSGTLLYASDFPGNRVRAFTTDGVWLRDIPVPAPGALAIDDAGNVWVAQKNAGAVLEFSAMGSPLNAIQMSVSSRPSSLYFDAGARRLLVGDQGPDMNIKIYDVSGSAGTPALVGTFGVQGGYLDTTTGIKGQVGDKRFTRVAGIGKDATGTLYVLNNPWGGTWDLGRDGGTDIHAYDTTGRLKWKLQSLNFEGNGVPDPGRDGGYFYGGSNVYTGRAGGTFVANTVDPIDYPADPRLGNDSGDRDQHFAQLATIGRNRILVAAGQNPAHFYFFHFNAANGYIAIPDGSLPGALFNTDAVITGGFCLDSKGDVWAGPNGADQIWHYRLIGFDAEGKPSWGAPIVTPVPASVRPLTRIVYLPESDTMILAQGVAGIADWSTMSGRVEIYHGWLAGNTSRPNPIINLGGTQPKSITAAGHYLFVGYVHTVPDINAFDLNSGNLVATFVNSNPGKVSVGNDVDSMYGLRSYLRSTGEYVITKDNYNSASLILYRWTP